MAGKNLILFTQFSKTITKTFKNKGGIDQVYEIGHRKYNPLVFNEEKNAILSGNFIENGVVSDDLFYAYGIRTIDGRYYAVLIYDPFDVWSNEFILEILAIDAIPFEKLPKKLLQ